MELNFSEIEQTNPYLNENKNQNLNHKTQNYWEKNVKTENQTEIKKKKVTFDDILTNMNLVVSKDGTLQSMIPKKSNDNYTDYYNESELLPQNYQYNPMMCANRQNNIKQTHQTQQNVKKIAYKQEPIDPSVKHSFIYNKYFKDYKDAIEQQPIVKVPKTMEEYRKMLLEYRINKIKEKKRIAEIKSTKLLFENVKNINVTKNNLKTLNFY
jgi:hypothetical protein